MRCGIHAGHFASLLTHPPAGVRRQRVVCQTEWICKAARAIHARAWRSGASMRQTRPCISIPFAIFIFHAAAPPAGGVRPGAVPAVPAGRSRRPFRRSCGGWRRLRVGSLRSMLGVFMAGFVSVLSSRGAGVVARPLSCGWVWARRALPGGAGWSPAPACVFVPFGSFAMASAFSRGVSALGWRVWVRPGSAGSSVWSACSLPVPAFSVKVALPAGLSCRAACAALPPVPALSSLGALGV
jgi:hypothetical protein